MTHETKPEIEKAHNVAWLIGELARIEREADEETPSGWTLPDALQLDFSDVVGDYLGVPPECDDASDPDGNFREVMYYAWQDVVRGEWTADEFINYVTGMYGLGEK